MTTTLVYKYGLHAPFENADLVYAQMRAAHRYRNTLVEIERGRRIAIRNAELTVGDMQAALTRMTKSTAAREEAWKNIAKHRAKTRKRDESAELKTALKNAQLEEREARKALATLRNDLKDSEKHPELFLLTHQINTRAKELAANAYEHSGCYWGQRALVDEAAARSFSSIPLYSGGEIKDPNFVKSRGDGTVGLQIQGGLSVSELHSCEDSRVRLKPPVNGAWDSRVAKRKLASTAELSLRIGSDGRKPIFARWVCDMDRPLPKGATVTWASVHVNQVGPFSHWHLCLTLNIEKDTRTGKATTKGGAVAIDVGWRVEDDGLRVATWKDEQGSTGYLKLDTDTIDFLQSPSVIQSKRDDAFNSARLGLAWFLANPKVPEGLKRDTRYMMQWQSQSHLEQLWLTWRENRFEGDERIFSFLTSWRYKDRDAWIAQEKNRAQSLRRRREMYRVFAVQLAERYDTIIVEAFDKRDVAKKKDETENETARTNRVLAATSVLVDALKMAAKSRGRVYAALPCADTTRTCPSCGLVGDRDQAGSIVLICECGNVWDQDVGADDVLLARWRERLHGREITGSVRKTEKKNKNMREGESRWARAARLKAEKQAKLETARKAVAGAAE